LTTALCGLARQRKGEMQLHTCIVSCQGISLVSVVRRHAVKTKNRGEGKLFLPVASLPAGCFCGRMSSLHSPQALILSFLCDQCRPAGSSLLSRPTSRTPLEAFFVCQNAVVAPEGSNVHEQHIDVCGRCRPCTVFIPSQPDGSSHATKWVQ